MPAAAGSAGERCDFQTGNAANQRGEPGEGAGVVDPDRPRAFRATAVADARAAGAEGPVDGPAQVQEPRNRYLANAQDRGEGDHGPGPPVDDGGRMPAREVRLGQPALQRLGMAGHQLPADQQHRPAGELRA